MDRVKVVAHPVAVRLHRFWTTGISTQARDAKHGTETRREHKRGWKLLL